MGKPDFWSKGRVDVRQGHGRQFVPGTLQHPAGCIIRAQNACVGADPEKSLYRMIDGELSQFEGFLRLPQCRNIFVDYNSAKYNTGLVPNRNSQITNGLFRPIEAFE